MSDTDPPYAAGEDNLARVRAAWEWTPHAQALGLKLIRAEHARVWGAVPYRADLVGDPESGVIAGGVLTTLLDHTCGMAAILAMREPSTVATIDLRIDYMRPAEAGRDVIAEAHCYKIGKNVAFVRAVAYEDSADNPIANATSAFMVNASRRMGANLRSKRKP
ncbi:MAG: PaaI family thioesterase [Hyphomonadaceae bacterium]